jgi:hypothetical protein
MELTELKDNLQIVLDKEENDLATQGYSFYYQGSTAMSITYPNAETLIEIFSMLGNDSSLKSAFVKILENEISGSEEHGHRDQRTGATNWVTTSAIAFYALVKLGYSNEAIESLRDRQDSSNYIAGLLVCILDKHYFDSNQLKAISEVAKVRRFTPELNSALTNARFDLLKSQIRKVNVEINQDKKAVAEKINLLGLSGNYNELLKCIDNFIQTDTSRGVNAGMIATLRTFMADLLKDIAKRISENEREAIPKIEGRAEMGNIRGYLKTKLELSDKDDKFVDAFVDILHEEGGHSLVSEKEYFRLSRNIAIEIALFVLSKYEKKYKK